MTDQSSVFEGRGSAQQVVRRLADMIRLGGLHVSDQLPSARTLSEQMGVSRPTIGKAIQTLVDAGILRSNNRRGPRGGYVVQSTILPPSLLADHVGPSLGGVSSVLEARRVLEPRVAQVAGLVAAESDFATLDEIIEGQRAAADDPHRLRQLDAEFHVTIARATHNPTLVLLMHTLLEQLELTRNPSVQPGEATRTIEVHERTLRALMSRDPNTIDAAMDEHLAVMELAWERETGRSLRRKVPDFLKPERSGATSEREPA